MPDAQGRFKGTGSLPRIPWHRPASEAPVCKKCGKRRKTEPHQCSGTKDGQQ